DGRSIGKVLCALDLPADTKNDFRAPHAQARPSGGDAVAPVQWQWRAQDADEPIGNKSDDQKNLVKRCPQYCHVYSLESNESTTAARLSRTCVPPGKSPLSQVFWPLPVSTSHG